MDERHHLTFDTYEEGKLSLDDYLNRVIFFGECTVDRKEFKEFMFNQSKPYPEVIEFFRNLKSKYGLKVVAVSNEGRELTVHRIKVMDLNYLIDFYIASSFVHFRKPDLDIYKIALDATQVEPHEIIYIDDREMFVQIAETLGIKSIHHTSLDSTKAQLSEAGLTATISNL